MSDATDARDGQLVRNAIVAELAELGIELAVSVPDDWMSSLLNDLNHEQRIRQVRVSSEIEGVGICAGAYMGGMGACFLLSSPGFLMCGYHIGSLSLMYRIPLFMLLVWRGRIGDGAFYQEYPGILNEPMLKMMQIDHVTLSSIDDIGLIGDSYRHALMFRRPAAVLLTRDVFGQV